MLDAQYRLKQAGLRVTHSRVSVLNLLEQQPDDLSIKQIYQKLHVQHQQLSLATIYRVVSDLVDAGLIASYQFHRAETKFNLPERSKTAPPDPVCGLNAGETNAIFTVLTSGFSTISSRGYAT